MRQTWFSVTTNALNDWRAALDVYHQRLASAIRGHDAGARERADDYVHHARAEYRRRVLGWYRELLLPMQVGDAVPDEVSTLLAEEWDQQTTGGRS